MIHLIFINPLNVYTIQDANDNPLSSSTVVKVHINPTQVLFIWVQFIGVSLKPFLGDF